MGRLFCKRGNVRPGLSLRAFGLNRRIYVRLRLEDGCREGLAFREHPLFEEHERNFSIPRRVSHRGARVALEVPIGCASARVIPVAQAMLDESAARRT